MFDGRNDRCTQGEPVMVSEAAQPRSRIQPLSPLRRLPLCLSAFTFSSSPAPRSGAVFSSPVSAVRHGRSPAACR